MKIKFNEQNAIENMIKVNFVDENNITKTIYDLAKYNYHIKNMSDEDNYNHILDYITRNCHNIIEAGIYKDIDGCIKSAKKNLFFSVDEVPITKSELNFIKNLNNIKEEKAAFVMLAVAKFFNIAKNVSYDSAYMTHSEICKMARITIPAADRDVFMQFAYDKNVLHRHSYVGSIIKKLTFVSHDENDPVVFRLKEYDYEDLAYTYLAHLTPHKFRRCRLCKKWMKITSKSGQYCKECSDKQSTKIDSDKSKYKPKICVDCGATYYTSVFDNASCRCVKCREAYNIQLKAEQNKRYYESHKEQNSVGTHVFSDTTK